MGRKFHLLFKAGGRIALGTLVILVLGGCSAARLFNSLIPESGFVATRDIAFGPLPRLRLDVYRPVETTPAAIGPVTRRPVVVFFYGGAWESGERADFLFVAEALTSRGFVVVIPDYRLYPQVIFPAYMDDAALAMKWTFDHAVQFGGDPGKVFVMGHSAGAQLAALVASDATYLGRVGLDIRRIRGLVSLAGPLDFLPLTEPNLFLIFPESVRGASQPINFFNGREAPALLLHGMDDTRVGIHNSRNLAARIRARGGHVEEMYYPGMGHIGLLLAISAPLRHGKPVLERVVKFIDERSSAAP